MNGLKFGMLKYFIDLMIQLFVIVADIFLLSFGVNRYNTKPVNSVYIVNLFCNITSIY